MKTILVVDDELKITRLVRDYLHQAGFRVVEAATGAAALSLARTEQPDLILLDLGLPEMDGLDVTRTLRAESPVPIIMLTARSDETDRVVGLELGADDYIVKPFSPREVVARVRAVLRREELVMAASDVMQFGDVEVDSLKRRVAVGGTPIELTPTEFDILSKLLSHPGRVFTRSQLLGADLGADYDGGHERAIDSHIKNIRRKLEADPSRPEYVLTVHGIGYKFADAE